MLVVCNAPEAVGEVLADWHPQIDPARGKRVAALVPKQPAMDRQALQSEPLYRASLETIARLTA
jgi:beta-N-acetylhexosaminidase